MKILQNPLVKKWCSATAFFLTALVLNIQKHIYLGEVTPHTKRNWENKKLMKKDQKAFFEEFLHGRSFKWLKCFGRLMMCPKGKALALADNFFWKATCFLICLRFPPNREGFPNLFFTYMSKDGNKSQKNVEIMPFF